MIEHIVLFKIRPETTPEQREELMRALLSLKERLPGIVDATCGVNFSDRNRGYDIGFVVRFEDRAALKAYQEHPDHWEVVEKYVWPLTEGNCAVDYEF